MSDTVVVDANLPATYDAHYLALAYAEQCECWTPGKGLCSLHSQL